MRVGAVGAAEIEAAVWVWMPVTNDPLLELKVTSRVLASQPAKTFISELGVNRASASPNLVAVEVLLASYQPLNV